MSMTRIKPIFNKQGKLEGYEDTYTGEKYGFPVIVNRKKNPYSQGWVMNNQEAMRILARDKDIKAETHRVLWFIGGILDFENWVHISITEIAKELNMQRSSVSKAIKLLEKKEVILRGPKVGRSHTFMLNPEFGWKGKVKNLEKYREDKYKNREYQNKISLKERKTLEKTKISEFSEEFKYLSQKYDIPLDEIENFLGRKLDKGN